MYFLELGYNLTNRRISIIIAKTTQKEEIIKLSEELRTCSDQEVELIERRLIHEITDLELLIKTFYLADLYWLPNLRKIIISYLETHPDITDFNFDEASNFYLIFMSLYECSHLTFNKLVHNFKILHKNSKALIMKSFQDSDELIIKQFGILKLIYEKDTDINLIDYLFTGFEKFQEKLAYPAELGMTIVALNQTGSSPFCPPLRMFVLKLKNFQSSEHDRLRLYKAILHESYHMYRQTGSIRPNNGENLNVYKFLDEGCAELYSYKIYPNNDFLHLVDNITLLHFKKLRIKAVDIIFNFREYLVQRNIRSYEMATSFVKFCDTLDPDKSITELFAGLFKKNIKQNFIDELVDSLGQKSLDDLINLWESEISSHTLDYALDDDFKCEIDTINVNEITFTYSYTDPFYIEQSIFVLVDNTHIPLIMLSDNRYNTSGKFKIATNLRGKIEILMAIKNRVYSLDLVVI